MRNNFIIVALCILMIISVPLLIHFGSLNEIIISLTSSTIAACIFYFLLNYIPEQRAKNIIKKNVLALYNRQKKELLEDIVSYVDWNLANKGKLIDNLMNPKQFKLFFTQNGLEMTYNLWNNLTYENKHDIWQKLDIINGYLNMYIRHYAVEHLALLQLLDNYYISLQNLKNGIKELDDNKSFGRILVEILSTVDEQNDIDKIEALICKI